MNTLHVDNCNDELFAPIHYHNITHDDMVNGDGLRVVLWVAGCSHHCKNCQNPITWDTDGGIPFTQWDESEFWEWLSKPWTQGATFSGGDPLHPINRKKIGEMIRIIQQKYPNKDIWVYTGYRLRDDFLLEDSSGNVFELSYLASIDVLVDGKYEDDVRAADIAANRKVLWRGSSNQRIIDVKKSIAAGTILLHTN